MPGSVSYTHLDVYKRQRHSFATGLIRKGLPLSFLKDSLGHSDEKTTQLYMAGFTDKTRKDAAEALYHDLID